MGTVLYVAMVCVAGLGASHEPSGVALCGSPAAIGMAWGQINGAAIRADIEASYLEPARAKGVPQAALIERGQPFVEICREVAPHWLDEAGAIAAAADVDPALYTAYIGCVYRNLWAGEECTSYAVSPEYTEDHVLLFHKNRDNRAKPQAAGVIASNIEGVNRFITVTDASVLACMMMVNEKGLAGSADTGGLGPGTPKYRGMMNTFVLRHIAERAGDCGEALSIIREFVDKGYYAGGGGTGTHWLFMDASGAILEVSNNADEVVATTHDEHVYFSARADTPAAAILRNATQSIGFHTFHNVSRDASICFDSTISGMTVEISCVHPELLTCAWLTFPAKSVAFPVFMGCTHTPLALINGEVYELAKGIHDAKDTWKPSSAIVTRTRSCSNRGVRRCLRKIRPTRRRHSSTTGWLTPPMPR